MLAMMEVAFSRAVMDNRSRGEDKHMDSRKCAAHMLIHSLHSYYYH